MYVFAVFCSKCGKKLNNNKNYGIDLEKYVKKSYNIIVCVKTIKDVIV